MKLINLNLFTEQSTDLIEINHGRLATRFYIILLLISIFILIGFSNLSIKTISVTTTILNPSLEEYKNLENENQSTLICPCTQISTNYEDFMKIDVEYHQICSSDFIQSWWYQLFLTANLRRVVETDFLSLASSYFQALKIFCDIANLTINDSITRFLTTNFINSQLLTNQSFNLQINSSINTFISLTQTEFVYRMLLIRALIHSNQFISGVRITTSFAFLPDEHNHAERNPKLEIRTAYALNKNGTKCFCALDSTCILDHLLITNDSRSQIKWEFEGIVGGCSVIDSVLKSSLICWFKERCLTKLRIAVHEENILKNSSLVPLPPSITPLDSKLSSRFFPNTSMETILNEIMIEQWKFSYSFDKFYSKCQPLYCSFTYEKPSNLIYIITINLSLIGGINTFLKFISPFIIKIIFKLIDLRKRNRSLQVQTNYQHNRSYSNIIKQLKDKLLLLNLFDSESNNNEIINRERISTRLFLLIFIISIYSATIYTILLKRTTITSYSNPSENEYNDLLKLYSNTLNCPCQNISIKYKYLIEIQPLFHSICSSDFINKKWYEYLFSGERIYIYERRDIRVRGSAYFSFLSKLCQISSITINNTITQFLNETYLSTNIISQSIFNDQMNNKILDFQKLTLIKYSRSFQLIRDIMNGNAFVSSFDLNWYWWKYLNHSFDRVPISPIKMTNQCSCGTRNDCIESAGIHSYLNNKQEFTIPGFYISCSIVDTLLYSTFECFYNKTCLNLLLNYIIQINISYSYPINISIINYSNKSRFQINTSIEFIANELFIEKWNINKFYSSFYNQCSPINCTFIIEKDDYFIYTISKIFGLYGGLTVALQFAIPILVDISFRIRNRFQTNRIRSIE